MRWVLFLIICYVTLLVQTTLASVISFKAGALGPISPDLAACVAVFLAIRLRNLTDVLLAAWVLGIGVDLTCGEVGAGALGPMALSYVLGAWVMFRIAEALYRERPATGALLGGLFCLIAHTLWVTLQSILPGGQVSWGQWLGLIAQASLVAVYTAGAAPLVHFVLRRCDRWLVPSMPSRRGGSAR